jgi:hypothetical protein
MRVARVQVPLLLRLDWFKALLQIVVWPQSGQMFIAPFAKKSSSAPEEREVSPESQVLRSSEASKFFTFGSINIWSLLDRTRVTENWTNLSFENRNKTQEALLKVLNQSALAFASD